MAYLYSPSSLNSPRMTSLVGNAKPCFRARKEVRVFQGETRRGRMFPYLDDATCRGLDSELFYAESGAAIMKAKTLCASCPVREKCLEWAIKREEFGVWGGTTARERAGIRRERGLRLVPAGVA
jgi:WhiB family transcriptional regulator, redox-sensing transcriptional regulator